MKCFVVGPARIELARWPIMSRLLCQLSYGPVVDRGRIELPTCGL